MNNEPYYKKHVFFCLNERKDGESACAQHDAMGAFEFCKKKVKSLGISGPGGVRVNKAGCLDRCAGGPVMVVYPEGLWYTYVDHEDIEEIVQTHARLGGEGSEDQFANRRHS